MKKLIFAIFYITSLYVSAQNVQLFQQFNGQYDFTAVGNTLNASPNPCFLEPSSSEDLNLGPTQTIQSAHLYWSAPWPAADGGDYNVSLNGIPVVASRDFHLTAGTGVHYFSAYAEVTNIVLASGNGTYTFANLDIDLPATNACNNGTDFGGWAMYVIYEEATLTQNQISLFDGLEYVSANNPSLDITLTNIEVATDDLSKIGFLAWEGDASIANNETLLINGILIDNPPLNPGDNAFNGTNSYTNSSTLYNMDLDFYDLENIVQPGDTSILIQLTSSQDFVMVNNLITVVNSELPDATITIDGTGVVCESADNMNVDYTVYNINSTAPLPAGTPIAFYANGVLAGQSQTINEIPIDGSESNGVIISIPVGTPVVFDLLAVVDDIGNGTGIVSETDETNNEFTIQIDLTQGGLDLGPDVEGCVDTPVILDTGISNPAFLWQWFEGGVLIPGATNSTLSVLNDGIYTVEGYEGICFVTDEVEVHFNPQPIANPADDIIICNDGSNPGIYDLTVNDAIILGAQDPALFSVSYYETFVDSENGTNPILNPTFYSIILPAPQTIYARIEGQLGICYDLTEFLLIFPQSIAGAVPDFSVCDNDNTGEEVIDLPFEFNPAVLNGESPDDYTITYHLTQADADGDINALITPYSVPVPGLTLYIRLENFDYPQCYDVATVLINVYAPPGVPPPGPLVVCDSDNDGFAEFDLTLADLILTGGDPDLTVTYHGTMLDAENGVLPLPNPYTNDDPYNDNVWARVESLSTSCYSVIELLLEVRDSPVATTPAEPLRLCDDSVEDGFTFFDLTVVIPEVLGSLDPLEYDVYFYEQELDAIVAGDLALTAPDFSAAIGTPTNYLNISNPQIVYILVVGNMSSTMPNNGSNGCYDIVELELIVDPLPANLGPFELFLCDDELNGSTPVDEISTFDLTQIDALATGGDPDLGVTWYATPGDEATDNPIVDPTAYQNVVTPQTVVGRVESQFGCRTLITLTLTVLPNPTPNTMPTPLTECDDDDDGIVSIFDLTSKDAEIISGDPDISVLYYATLEEAQAGLPGTELLSPYTNTVPGGEIVYARVFRDVPPAILACYTIVELELIVVALPEMPIAGFLDPMFVCDDDGDGQAAFDLTLNDPFVIGTQPPADFVDPITYYTTEADAQGGINPITPATAFVSAGQTIWVRLESLVTGCVRITSFELVVGVFPTIGTGDDLYLCDDELNGSTPTDGISTFDLTQNTSLIDLGDTTLTVVYYGSADDQTNDIPITDPTMYQNIDSPQQEIFVTVFGLDGCPALSSFMINVEANPSAVEPTPLIACDDDNDGFYNAFDLTSKDAEIANGEPVSVVYYETLLDAQLGNPADQLLSPYENIVPFVQVIWARVINDTPPGVNPCYSIVSLELRVEQLPEPANMDLFVDPLAACDLDGDGFEEFDLTINDVAALGANDPASDFEVTYHESESDADLGINAIVDPTVYQNTSTPTQDLWVRVSNLLTGCGVVTPFSIVVESLPLLGAGPFEMSLCDDELSGSTTDGISVFDLTQNDDAITLGVTDYQVVYYGSADDQTNDVPIADPTAYENTSNPQDIYVSVFTQGGCESQTFVTIRVVSVPSPNTPLPLAVCDGSGDPLLDLDATDGISQFDLTSKDAEIIGGEPDVSVLYYESFEAAEAGLPGTEIPSPPDVLYTNIVSGSQIVYARITKDTPPSLLACYSIVELELIVHPLPEGTAVGQDLIECEVGSDQMAAFDLTVNDELLLAGQDGSIFQVLYYPSLADAQGGTNPILTPSAYINTQNPQQIFAGIVNLTTGCYIASQELDPDVFTLSFMIEVKEGVEAFEPLAYTICDNRDPSDGLGDFTLIVDPDQPTDLDDQAQALSDQILGSQDPTIYLLTFHETEADATDGINPLPNVYANITNPQVIYARVTNGLDPEDALSCFGVVPVLLVVEQLPMLELEDQYRICVDENGNAIPEEFGDSSPPVLETGLDGAQYSFLWSYNGTILPNEVGPSLVALQAGTYEVVVTELNTGCQVTATTTVVESSPPLQYDVVVSSGAFAGEHVIEATASGSGIYVFQLDGGPFQDSGTFTNVSPGSHVVTIQDANGCGSVSVEVGVVDYPQFITPNNDGYHDTWNIIGIAQADPTARIYIFDRYGKLLKQISPLGSGWDGTYQGQPLPSSDYWFRVEYTEEGRSKEFTGHFTLKR